MNDEQPITEEEARDIKKQTPSQRRRKGSDPEDIFCMEDDPNSGESADDEYDEETAGNQTRSSELMKGGRKQFKEESYDVEEEAHRLRKQIQLDASFMFGRGSFLLLGHLISRELFDPVGPILDENTGCRVVHFVAHHGNLKCLRYLAAEAEKKGMSLDIKDKYNCGLAHYAVRSGHLPILMFCVEKLNIDITTPDNFGYTALDYAAVYQKPHCFIFLYFKCKQRTLTQMLLPTIIQSLCSSADGKIVKEGELSPSMKILSIMLRDDNLAKQTGQIIMANAIQAIRPDIVKDAYECLYYFPKQFDGSQKTFCKSNSVHLTVVMIATYQTGIQAQTHMSKQEMATMGSILRGEATKQEKEVSQPSCSRGTVLFLTYIIVTTTLMYLSIVTSDSTKFAHRQSIYDKTFFERARINILEETMISRVSSGFWSMVIDTMQIGRLLFWILGTIHFLLFLCLSKKSLYFNSKNEYGMAMELLAKEISCDNRAFSTLVARFDKICYKCMLQHGACDVEHCSILGGCVVQNHGYSEFFRRSINFSNFRPLALTYFTTCAFLACILFHFWLSQLVVQEMKSTGPIFRLIELHIMAIVHCFDQVDNLKLLIGMVGTEVLLAYSLQNSLEFLIAIGRGLTLQEVNRPWDFAKQKIGSAFGLRKKEYRNPRSGKKKSMYFIAWKEPPSFLAMVINLLKFIFCCQYRNLKSKRVSQVASADTIITEPSEVEAHTMELQRLNQTEVEEDSDA